MNRTERRLIVFARHPEPGLVKTRLIPALGPEGAAALHRRMVLRTLRQAKAACDLCAATLEVRFSGGSEDAVRHWLGLGPEVHCRLQSGADLGDRMDASIEQSFREGAASTVIIGTDCPGLTREVIVSAFEALAHDRAVFGPADDGGYYLVGLRLPGLPELFRGVPWGTNTVLAESLAIVRRHALAFSLLPPLPDVDVPADLIHWQSRSDADENDLGRISVILPAWNEGALIGECLNSVQAGCPREILVVDGGSSDDTVARAQAAGAIVLPAPPGRARQMNAGAAQANGHVLLFLHADTLLPPAWPSIVQRCLKGKDVAAGAFSFGISGHFVGRRFIEQSARLRSRWWQQPFGDQGLFLRRSIFEELGGFANLPIMEDYEFNRRLRRRGRIVTVPESVRTSGRRWETLGVFRTTLINQMMILGYHLGVSPARLASLYRGSVNRGR